MIFLCSSIGPNICQVGSSSLRALASIPEQHSRNTRLDAIFHKSSPVVRVAFSGYRVLWPIRCTGRGNGGKEGEDLDRYDCNQRYLAMGRPT